METIDNYQQQQHRRRIISRNEYTRASHNQSLFLSIFLKNGIYLPTDDSGYIHMFISLRIDVVYNFFKLEFIN